MTILRHMGEASSPCAEVERRLDAGDDPREEAALMAHVQACERCRAALEAMSGVDAWFAEEADPLDGGRLASGHRSPAPEGFTDRVMARVAAIESSAGAAPRLAPDPMPWWVQIVLQPSAVLAGILAALLVWRFELLVSAATMVPTVLARWGIDWNRWTALVPAAGHSTDSLAVIGILLGMLPLVLLGAAALVRWTERLVER